MEYNTSKPGLFLPEYGRHIQNMIETACDIRDREERNKVAKAIIVVMGQLNPHLRDITDYTHKLWDHLFIISNFKLDVDSPYPKPSPETFTTKPDRVKYPHHNIKFKHYGKIVEAFVEKAMSIEEGDEKVAFTEDVANLMKKSYINWNKDVVNDEIILDHMALLSDGKLKVKENTKLAFVNIAAPPRVNTGNPKNKKKSGGKQHGHSHRKY
jgi:hypothetical protein